MTHVHNNMVMDAVPEARSYIVNRNGKGKSNGKGLAWRKLKRQNTNWVERIHLKLSNRFAALRGYMLKKMCVFCGKKYICSGGHFQI